MLPGGPRAGRGVTSSYPAGRAGVWDGARVAVFPLDFPVVAKSLLVACQQRERRSPPPRTLRRRFAARKKALTVAPSPPPRAARRRPRSPRQPGNALPRTERNEPPPKWAPACTLLCRRRGAPPPSTPSTLGRHPHRHSRAAYTVGRDQLRLQGSVASSPSAGPAQARQGKARQGPPPPSWRGQCVAVLATLSLRRYGSGSEYGMNGRALAGRGAGCAAGGATRATRYATRPGPARA